MSDKLIRRREVCERTGLSYTTVWRMEKAGRFPQRVKLDPDNPNWWSPVAWHSAEVDAWIRGRIRVAGRMARPDYQDNGAAA